MSISNNPTKKVKVTLCIDKDVLAWFKQNSKDWEAKINDVLKTYMETHKG